jgi:hypothetical protein
MVEEIEVCTSGKIAKVLLKILACYEHARKSPEQNISSPSHSFLFPYTILSAAPPASSPFRPTIDHCLYKSSRDHRKHPALVFASARLGRLECILSGHRAATFR